MATIAARIREAMERKGIKQSELVSMTGIGKSSISTYLSGEYEPKQRNIYKIAALDVNEAWLMGEDVPMDRAYLDSILKYQRAESQSGRTQVKEDLFRLFGTEHTVSDLRLQGDKIALLYYKAMDRRCAPELKEILGTVDEMGYTCLLYTSPSPRDGLLSRMT